MAGVAWVVGGAGRARVLIDVSSLIRLEAEQICDGRGHGKWR